MRMIFGELLASRALIQTLERISCQCTGGSQDTRCRPTPA